MFFDKTGPTKEIWYYEIPLLEGRKNLSKTKPLKEEHFNECKNLWREKELSEQSWLVSAEEFIKNSYNLDIKNPNKETELKYLAPEELIATIEDSEKKIISLLLAIKKMIK